MTKLEKLNMELSKLEAIKENLDNRMKNLENSKNKYKIDSDKLYNAIKNVKKNNKKLYLDILLIIIVSFLGTNVLLDLNLGLLYEQIIKIIGMFVPMTGIYFDLKKVAKNINKIEYLRNEYSISSQNLFADEFFLKNTKENIIKKDNEIKLIKEEINKLEKKKIDYVNINKIDNYDYNIENSKVYVKKLNK